MVEWVPPLHSCRRPTGTIFLLLPCNVTRVHRFVATIFTKRDSNKHPNKNFFLHISCLWWVLMLAISNLPTVLSYMSIQSDNFLKIQYQYVSGERMVLSRGPCQPAVLGNSTNCLLDMERSSPPLILSPSTSTRSSSSSMWQQEDFTHSHEFVEATPFPKKSSFHYHWRWILIECENNMSDQDILRRYDKTWNLRQGHA